MNDEKQNSRIFIRQITFIILVLTMVFQPATQTFAFFVQGDYELVNYDWDNDSKKKKEKKEKDSKDEKIENQVVNEYPYLFTCNKKPLCYWKQASLWDVHLEIPIPPPEQV